MKAQERLTMDIQPQQYDKLQSRQLGNHHLYKKISHSSKWNDTRLRVLEPCYFHQKTVLDIGCNQGILAIPIAIKYQPHLIKAIDIDKSLVNKCIKNIDKFKAKNSEVQKCENKLPKQLIKKISELPLYFQQKIPQIQQQKMGNNQIITIIPPIQFNSDDDAERNIPRFPENIACEILNVLTPKNIEYYDTIICMNVTKWIHLALGDSAIKRLFGNASSMLHEGGIFILQAQPWSSYRKKKNLYKIYRQNYQKIYCKPEKFKDILKSLGLFLIKTIQPTGQNAIKHRIQIFQKRGFYSSDAYL